MIKALVFDAYGTPFDVHSVLARCEELFPGHGTNLTAFVRTKQLEYTWLRSLMGKYEDFWQITQDGLMFACRSLGLATSQNQIDYLMQSYLTLSPFPEIATALEALGTFPARSYPTARQTCSTAWSETPGWKAGCNTSSAWTKFAFTNRIHPCTS